MADLDNICVRLIVEEKEHEVLFSWGEEYAANMEIDDILDDNKAKVNTE